MYEDAASFEIKLELGRWADIMMDIIMWYTSAHVFNDCFFI